MSDTFGQTWKSLLLQCPFLPVPLAQQWVRDRYRQAIDKCTWGGQVAQGQFILPDAYSTGTVTVTQSSATVTGVGTAFTSTLINQQLIIGGTGPFYNISAVPDAVTLTLDQVYGGATSSGASFEIAQVYVTPPSDFLAFKTIKDPVNNWSLRFNISQEYLDRVDARRTTTGSAWIFADYRQTSGGIPRYEVWPRVLSNRLYPFLYWRRPADVSADSDTFMFPLRGDEIKRGALADLATWPGTETRKNPAFNLNLAAKYEKDFQGYLNDLMRVDQEIYLNDYVGPDDSWNSLNGVPIDSKFLQSHDF